MRYFDADSRRVSSDTPGAEAIEMIPLALYGLEHAKIPALLVDFRDQGNPKRRELTKRVVSDDNAAELTCSHSRERPITPQAACAILDRN